MKQENSSMDTFVYVFSSRNTAMLSSTDIYIRPIELTDTHDLLKIISNRTFLQPFEPIQDENFFTFDFQYKNIEERIQEYKNDKSYSFGVYLHETNALIGRITLSNVTRGPFQNSYIGYFMDEQYNGKGYATQAIHLALKFAFEEINLHRVQAGTLTGNTASIRVLQKNKFRYEGLAKRYLKINGHWEDHNLYAITREEWRGNLQY